MFQFAPSWKGDKTLYTPAIPLGGSLDCPAPGQWRYNSMAICLLREHLAADIHSPLKTKEQNMSILYDALGSIFKAHSEISLRQMMILLHCEKTVIADDRQVKQIAHALSLPTPVVSRAGDALETAGLIKRSALKTDRRTCVFTLTAAARRLLRKAGAESAKAA